MDMLAIGLFVYLFLSVSFIIARGLYYSGMLIRIGKEIERLAVRYEATSNAAASYLKAGDIEAYEALDKLLQLYEERIEDLNKEFWVYVEKSRKQA